MRVLYIATCALLFTASSASHVSGQTADQTIAYINGKIKGAEKDLGSYKLKLDGVGLNGSTFVFMSTTTQHLSGLGDETTYKKQEIDLVKTRDFTPFSITRLLGDSRAIDLMCDDSYGDCVQLTECEVDCSESDKHTQSELFINVSPLSNSEEEKQVKKAIVYLKSLFPFHKNIETFEKQP
jgi:hypothetical protein